MFLFKKLINRNKEPEESKSKWQHKLYLAQINPEDDFDLSNCSIKCLPSGVYSQCKVFRKEKLLLNDNNLTSIPDDNDNCMDDLFHCISILDVSRNLIKSLPSNLNKLANLKELYLSNNLIRSVPDSFIQLRSLELIDISYNQLNIFPSVLCDILTLRHIDISHNELITQLSSKVCNLHKLEKLLIDGTNIKHPPKRICDQGVESIFTFFTHDILKDDLVKLFEPLCSSDFGSQLFSRPMEPKNEDSLQDYLAKKDDRKKTMIEFEKCSLEESRLMKNLNNKIVDKRQEILIKMRQDQLMLHKELEALNLKKIGDKSRILEELSLIESHSTKLLNQLKCFSAKSTEKKARSFNESDRTNDHHQYFLISKLEEKLRQYMISKDETKKCLQSELVKEDESLYQAICNFFEMKNTHSRVMAEQIALIENELYHLSKAELQTSRLSANLGDHQNNFDKQMMSINEQRIALASLLKVLLSQKRPQSSIEGIGPKVCTSPSSEAVAFDYPSEVKQNVDLFDRLLDDLDESVIKLFLPLITNGSITFQKLIELTNDELKSFDIKEEHIALIRKHIALCTPEIQLTPSSAPMLEQIVPKPSAPPMKLWFLIECVICLDDQSKIIFIPCGHVCTCLDCSKSISLCPICRAEIFEKIISN